MESLFILIPVALFFLTVVIVVFFWAVKSGQFEDFDTEARRILFDEDSQEANKSKGLTTKQSSDNEPNT